MKTVNVLITHSETGGVYSYIKQLYGKFNVTVKYLVVGKRATEKGSLSRISRMFADYWRFAKCLKSANVDLVHINPSLDLKSFIRDGVFAILARAYNKKVVVFFHGWQKSFETWIERRLLWIFRLLFGQSHAFIVLCDEFKKRLGGWGVVQPIYKEVTVINEDELEGFNIQDVLIKRQNSNRRSVLFLSRVVKDKGIYETVEAISLLHGRYPEIELIVAGAGDELENVKSLVRSRSISNVIFVGHVEGKEKRRVFEKAQIFCFPTSHGEGLPCAVIEAMAYGLPIVTRPVGGLADFFKNDVHGFISDSLNPKIFANFIEKLFLDKNLYERISLYNYQYAQSHFLASDAVLRLETIYKTVLSSGTRIVK